MHDQRHSNLMVASGGWLQRYILSEFMRVAILLYSTVSLLLNIVLISSEPTTTYHNQQSHLATADINPLVLLQTEQITKLHHAKPEIFCFIK